MSSASKRKGSRVELQIAKELTAAGIPTTKVPLSGALGGEHSGDLVLRPVEGKEYRGEVKARKTGAGFVTLEGWKGDLDLLFLKRNNRQPMVCMDLDLFIELVKLRG